MTVKKSEIVKIIKTGMYLSPSFSLPLEISPKINEPMMDVMTIDRIVYVVTKRGVTLICEKETGSCCEREPVGS